MPEGDTVWNTARVLERALAGDVLTGSDFRVPQLATTDLSGWTVAESASRGKHLLLRLTRDGQAATLHSHLRMDGAWRAYAPGERWSGRPAHLIRVVLRTARSVAVGYHLHELTLMPDRRGGAPSRPPRPGPARRRLGPRRGGPADPRDAGHRHRGGAARPAQPGRRRQPLQVPRRCSCAGCGRGRRSATSRIWPARSRSRRSWSRRTRAAGRRPRPDHLRRGETSYVYGRRAQPCRRCGTAIRKAEQGDRVTYWCPRCQPEPP